MKIIKYGVCILAVVTIGVSAVALCACGSEQTQSVSDNYENQKQYAKSKDSIDGIDCSLFHQKISAYGEYKRELYKCLLKENWKTSDGHKVSFSDCFIIFDDNEKKPFYLDSINEEANKATEAGYNFYKCIGRDGETFNIGIKTNMAYYDGKYFDRNYDLVCSLKPDLVYRSDTYTSNGTKVPYR